jgi:hypothetical protein
MDCPFSSLTDGLRWYSGTSTRARGRFAALAWPTDNGSLRFICCGLEVAWRERQIMLIEALLLLARQSILHLLIWYKVDAL